MKINRLPYAQIPQLSPTDLAYQTEDPRLRPFYLYRPCIEEVAKVVEAKDYPDARRQLLCEVLERQYELVPPCTETTAQIQALRKSETYTVTTAHQPLLLGGPLYFIYKIAGAIHLAQKLQAYYPQYRFIPLYWMGGEDHDFEEVNHLYLFGKKLTWEDKQGGAVADYQIDSLLPLLEELKIILGESPNAEELKTIISAAFDPQYNYGQAMFRLVHSLFADKGLVVLLPDAPELKSQMIPIFEEELRRHSSKKIIDQTVAQLSQLGFKNQAFVRDVNLFYLMPRQRERIEKDGENFRVLNSGLLFSSVEMFKVLHEQPQVFSPNVILRPLYQELVLPNIVYIGGGGELAYWLERKAQFEHYGIPFPMLLRRNSLQWIDAASQQKMEKLGLGIVDIFQDPDSLIKQYIERQSGELSFVSEREALGQIFELIRQKTSEFDSSLEASVAAQEAQLLNALDKLETRLLRSEKKNKEIEINQIRKVLEKLLPAGGLQERKESFIPLYLRFGAAWIDDLVSLLDPFEKDFWVVEA